MVEAPEDRETKLMGDPQYMTQIMVNLISNSIKFIQGVERAKRIVVSRLYACVRAEMML